MDSKSLWLSVMAVIIILIAVFAFLVIETKHPGDLSGDTSGYSDMELAEIAVREFTGNPSIVLEYEGEEEYNYAKFYQFSTAEGNRFYVDSASFDVCLAYFPGGRDEEAGVKISLEEAEEIARNFIADKSSISEAGKLQTIEAELLDHGSYSEYSLIFNEVKDDVFLFNNALITLNPSTGDVITYMRLFRETEISLVPAISEKEALRIAEDQFEGIVVTESDAKLTIHYPEDNEQKLIWMVEITGEPKDYVMMGGSVTIDAQTGEVYLKSPFL